MGALGLGILVVAFALGPLFAWAHAAGPATGKRVSLDWPAGFGATEVADTLQAAGLIRSPRWMALYLWFTRAPERIRPGRHLLSDHSSPAEIVERLTRSSSRARARVTFPEGWTHLEMAARLEEREVCPRPAFVEAVHAPELLAKLGIHAASAEGYLFPATYLWPVDSDASEVVETLVSEFHRRMERLTRAHPGAREALRTTSGWGDQEIVVLASIVEKETARPEERPLIAGVYQNRLTQPDFEPRGRLQSDPTAAYGCLISGATIPSCAGYNGRVTPAMLRDAANPYNTYRHAGLPPGPIANPGEASLRAALAPAATDYRFFVSTGLGAHKFSKTYEEHQQATKGDK